MSPNQSKMQQFYIEERDKYFNQAVWRVELMERFRKGNFGLTKGTEDTPLTYTVTHTNSAASAQASHAGDGQAIASPLGPGLSDTDGGAAPGGVASETGLADLAVPLAAGNGRNAEVADPLLPLLAFTLQENLRSYKEVRISMDTDKTSIRYKSRSLREYDQFCCRLNQPTKWSQGTTDSSTWLKRAVVYPDNMW